MYVYVCVCMYVCVCVCMCTLYVCVCLGVGANVPSCLLCYDRPLLVSMVTHGSDHQCFVSVCVSGIFPSDYNGWLAYAAFNSSKGFSAFLGNFSVPDKPEEPPDVLYLFTGLQNKDWVPLVDPEKDGAGFDIIQVKFSSHLAINT